MPSVKIGSELSAEFAAREVDWYRRNGRFADRIARDSQHREYVIGDVSWNRDTRPREYIEWVMSREVTPNNEERKYP